MPLSAMAGMEAKSKGDMATFGAKMKESQEYGKQAHGKIPCDMVVMAVGSRKNVLDVEGVAVPVYYAGDCSGDRTASIAEAIRGGYKAANQI